MKTFLQVCLVYCLMLQYKCWSFTTEFGVTVNPANVLSIEKTESTVKIRLLGDKFIVENYGLPENATIFYGIYTNYLGQHLASMLPVADITTNNLININTNVTINITTNNYYASTNTSCSGTNLELTSVYPNVLVDTVDVYSDVWLTAYGCNIPAGSSVHVGDVPFSLGGDVSVDGKSITFQWLGNNPVGTWNLYLYRVGDGTIYTLTNAITITPSSVSIIATIQTNANTFTDTNTFSAGIISPNFIGNGANLTNLNATSLASGTLIKSNSWMNVPTLAKGDRFDCSSNGVPHVIWADEAGTLHTNRLVP